MQKVVVQIITYNIIIKITHFSERHFLKKINPKVYPIIIWPGSRSLISKDRKLVVSFRGKILISLIRVATGF